jgi:hypothetical protein
MDQIFIVAAFVVGLVAGSGLTLCLAALAGMRDPDDGDAGSEYL